MTKKTKGKMMEDLTHPSATSEETTTLLPNITQYEVRLPFRVAIVGQTDSRKTHSIMKWWLGGKISFWKPNDKGLAVETELQHCLYCSNGGMSEEEKSTLLAESVKNNCQKLFHLNRFLSKQDIFEFVSRTPTPIVTTTNRKKQREQ